MLQASRVKREFQLLQQLLPNDIACKQVGDNLREFKASITGPCDTPYSEGIFKVEVRLPDRYDHLQCTYFPL